MYLLKRKTTTMTMMRISNSRPPPPAAPIITILSLVDNLLLPKLFKESTTLISRNWLTVIFRGQFHQRCILRTSKEGYKRLCTMTWLTKTCYTTRSYFLFISSLYVSVDLFKPWKQVVTSNVLQLVMPNKNSWQYSISVQYIFSTINISRQTFRNCKSLYACTPSSEVVDSSYLQQ